MHYEIKINNFEGPLDLLLHLVKKSNIDIYNINLVEITNQYLDYINAMEELNLDIASEYLVVAAELMELKSKSLLPKQIVEEDSYEEEEPINIIDRLIEYKKYKEITEEFRDLEEKRQEIFTKIPSNYDEYLDGTLIKNSNLSIEDLLSIMNKFLDRKELERPLNTTITTKEYSIRERINNIKSILKAKKQITLNDLFEIREKSFIVITFLSILEMVKNNEINMIQNKNFDDIVITKKDV